MPFKPRPWGITHDITLKVCRQVTWKCRGQLNGVGLDHQETAFQIYPRVFSATKRWDATRGMNRWNFIWKAAMQQTWHLVLVGRHHQKMLSLYQLPSLVYEEPEDESETFRVALAAMSDRQRQFLTEYLEKGTLEAVGEQHGLTRERVRQIIAKGLNRAKQALSAAEAEFLAKRIQYAMRKRPLCESENAVRLGLIPHDKWEKRYDSESERLVALMRKERQRHAGAMKLLEERMAAAISSR